MSAVRSLAFLAAAVLALPAYAAIQRQQAADSKERPAQAGFRDRVADERRLPARQLVAQGADGTTVYTVSDPEKCTCLYVGGPGEYGELERLRLERVRAHEQRLIAWSPYAQAAVWGPWKPEGLDLK